MQFKAGDSVVHPIYGVGYIVMIEEKQFSDIRTRLYYRITLSIRHTIWIPVEAQSTIGLRLVTAKSNLDQYRNLLKSHPTPTNKPNSQRYVELISRLKKGSFQVMCEVVRDLTVSSRQKSLGSTDRAILLKTRENLCQEWAVAAGISNIEAIKEIDALLQTTQQTSNMG